MFFLFEGQCIVFINAMVRANEYILLKFLVAVKMIDSQPPDLQR